MMDRDPYKLWEVLGTWAAAIATFAAVLTSLWLARKAERPRLRVTVEAMKLVDPSKVLDPERIRLDEQPTRIFLVATNVGMTRIRINSVGWHWWLIRDKGSYQNPPERQDQSHPWPATLEHGDQLQWILPFEDIVEHIAENMLSTTMWWRTKLQFLRVIVGTSTGRRFLAPPSPTLKQAIGETTARIRARRKKWKA
jgi:hypothetical protein